jgi:hypothetical protein
VGGDDWGRDRETTWCRGGYKMLNFGHGVAYIEEGDAIAMQLKILGECSQVCVSKFDKTMNGSRPLKAAAEEEAC